MEMDNKVLLLGLLALTVLVVAVAAFILLGPGEEMPPPGDEKAASVKDRIEEKPKTRLAPPPETETHRERIVPELNLAGPESDMPASYRNALGGFRGRVLETNGSPVAGMEVTLLGADFHDMIPDVERILEGGDYAFAPKTVNAVTGDDGVFLLAGVHTLAFHALVIDPEGPRTLVRVLDIQPGPGEVKDLGDFTLLANGIITGRITDDMGRPLAGARIRAGNIPPPVFLTGVQDYREGCLLAVDFFTTSIFEPPPLADELFRMLPIPETVTAEDGAFRLEGVPEDRVVVMADREGFVSVQHGPVTPKDGQTLDVGDLALGSGWTYRARVVDENDRPIPNVEVRTGAVRTIDEVVILGRAVRTDTQGRVTVKGLATPKVTAVYRRRAGDAWTTADPVNPDDGEAKLVLPAEGEIRVRVLGPDGKIVPEATLCIRILDDFLNSLVFMNPHRIPRDHMTRDEEGIFVITGLSPGGYEILAASPGTASAIEKVKLDKETITVDVALGAAHEIPVRVVDDITGEPVEYARVYAFEDDDDMIMRAGKVSRTRTDAEGKALLKKVPANDEMHVAASHPAYAVTELDTPVPMEGELELRLIKGGALEGVVYPGRTGPEPPYFLACDFRGRFDSPEGETPRFTATDLEGKFRMDNLTPGEWRIEVLPRFLNRDLIGLTDLSGIDDLHRTRVNIVSGETTRVEMIIGVEQVGPSTSISGRISIEGRPVANARVRVYAGKNRQVRTDAQGRYLLEKVPTGRHSLYVDDIPEEVLAGKPRISRTVHVEENIPLYEDFEILAGELSVRVVDSEGRLIPGKHGLVIRTLSGDAPYQVSLNADTQKDGSAIIGPLPVGSYQVSSRDHKLVLDVLNEVKIEAHRRTGPLDMVKRPVTTVSGHVDVTGIKSDSGYSYLMLQPKEGAGGRHNYIRVDLKSGDFSSETVVPGLYTTRLYVPGIDEQYRFSDLSVPHSGVSGVVLIRQ